MNQDGIRRLPEIISQNETEILAEWIRLQREFSGSVAGPGRDGETTEISREFLKHFTIALGRSGSTDSTTSEWTEVRDLLSDVSRTRARQGYSASQTATFIFSLKQPLFNRIRATLGSDADSLADALWAVSILVDKLGLFTIETYQKGREDVINRQQQELMELSTPVVRLWHDVLALPLIGTLDSGRTQVVMESLLQEIVTTGASIAIIDITGVPTVDTLVAQHLLKTVAAARLMGADCIISGIRPQIAQTIVHLGVELNDVITKASLADAFAIALKRLGQKIVSAESRQGRQSQEENLGYQSL